MNHEEVNATVEQLAVEWRKFRNTHAANVAALERKVTDLETRAARPILGGGTSSSSSEVDTEAFVQYVRSGGVGPVPRYQGMDATTSTNGSITIPTSFAAEIQKVAATYSGVGSLIRRLPATNGSFNIPVATTLPGTQWTADTGTRSATSTPNFQNVQPPSGELNAVASISAFLLDDS